MSETPMLPDECRTMVDVRAGVDATDRELMVLLERRYAYMRAAARIKPDRGAVRDEARKAEVIDNARKDADRRGLPGENIQQIWDVLVESSIAYELGQWDAIRA